MTDYADEQDRIIEEFEADAEEAAFAAFEDLLRETTGSIEHGKSGLLNKLKLFPKGDFPISMYSEYRDPSWTLSDPTKGRPHNLPFDREVPGANELKRALTYHLIPAFTPFTRIKAFSSTRSKAYDYRFVDMYLLQPNKLTAVPGHLALITLPMLNQALDDAKSSGQPSHYTGLFFYLRFWSSLSMHKLIPTELRLSAELTGIDTKERHKDVLQYFAGSLQSWVPFSESELEKLVNHSLFWLNDDAPRLLEAKNFLVDSGIADLNMGKIKRVNREIEFERLMTICIDGKMVLDYTMKEGTQKNLRSYRYYWLANYAQAIDQVRDAVFVFVALVTGLRRTELAVLNFDDVILGLDGRYSIDVTRFKTSNDVNYGGEVELLPLPKYVGDVIATLKSLRGICNLYRNGYIFQTAFSTTAVTNERPNLPYNIIQHLEEATGIERIHPHRFRKTIAEILIHRSERNIDVIRLLFGHHSYAMTLRYISRNPYLVRSVAVALEESYSKEFHEIISGVRDGPFSGAAAERLAKQINERPEEFRGKRLKVSVLVYISHLLTAGTPIYVGRTALGTYCVTGDQFSADNLPPCIAGRARPEGRIQPDPTNCQIECRNTVVIGKARASMEENIRFYEALLEANTATLNARTVATIQKKIDAQKKHLDNLHHSEHLKSARIPVAEVS